MSGEEVTGPLLRPHTACSPSTLLKSHELICSSCLITEGLSNWLQVPQSWAVQLLPSQHTGGPTIVCDEPSGSMGWGGTSSHTPASSVPALISQHVAQRPLQPATPVPRVAQPAPIWLGQGRAGMGQDRGGAAADEVGVGLAQLPAVSQARSISHLTSGGWGGVALWSWAGGVTRAWEPLESILL